MKEFIVIFSTVILGIALSGFVLGLGDKAGDLNDTINENFTQIESTMGSLLDSSSGGSDS